MASPADALRAFVAETDTFVDGNDAIRAPGYAVDT